MVNEFPQDAQGERHYTNVYIQYNTIKKLLTYVLLDERLKSAGQTLLRRSILSIHTLKNLTLNAAKHLHQLT